MTLGQGNLLYNRYRVVEILGRGGMGAVYRAIDESLGVNVAVKENLFTTDDYARQFRMEAVILAGIRHPNLPRVTDHFVIEDMGQYLVMDYIEGDDLRQRMEKSGPISEAEAIRIGCATCDALTYLHSCKPPILHRDIKLGNIKLASNGQVCLVDFGLAKMGWEHEETMTGARAMTPGYSPPEQYGAARTDARSDIYSLGATLYAALTAVIPEDSLMRAVDGVKLTPLRNHRPDVSPQLAAVIEKAMEVAAANRFQTAEAFKQALLAVEAEIHPQSNDAGAGSPVVPAFVDESASQPPEQKSGGGNWRLAVLAALLVLIIAGSVVLNPAYGGQMQALLFAASPTPGKPAQTQAAALPVAAASATPMTQVTATSQPTKTISAASATARPSATKLPTATMAATNTSLPASATPAATATTQLTATTAAAIPAVSATVESTASPDPAAAPTAMGGGLGQIAYAAQAQNATQIFLVNADGSNPQQITNEPEGACSFDWSPDGQKLVYTSPCPGKRKEYPGSTLYILDMQSGKREALAFKAGGDFEPAWSPDGGQILFSSLRDGSLQIYLYTLADGSLKKLTQTANGISAHYPAWSPDGSQIAFTALRSGLLQIWTMKADGSGQKQAVRTGGAFSDYLPSWSPDGTSVIFSETNTDLSAPATLKRFNVQTGQVDALPVPLPAVDGHFSPDGLWIAYESVDAKSGYQDVFLWKLFGGSPMNLTRSATADFDAVWRPGK